MSRCPRCGARMLHREGAARIVCLACSHVVRDDPQADSLASFALEESTRPIAPYGRHSKREVDARYTDGLTHIRGTHDRPWRSDMS